MNSHVQIWFAIAVLAAIAAALSYTPEPPRKYYYHVSASFGAAAMDTTINSTRPLSEEDMPEVHRVLKEKIREKQGVAPEALVITCIYELR